MNGLILDALYAKYHADKSDAVAKLDVYLNNSVGIGEHPDILNEMDKFIEKFAEAQGKLDSLKMMLSHVGNGNQDTKQLLND
jgi:hypothetical protein